MAGAKPTLGFASRTDAVLALRAQGLSQSAVADKIGIAVATVSALECSGRRRGSRRAQTPGLAIRQDLRSLLALEAERRSSTVTRLANDLLEAVLTDDLVDAVLDDQFREELAN